MVKDSGADDEHLLSGRTRPAHTRAGQAGLELLNATLDSTRANGVALFMKLLVLHTVLVRTEIVSVVG